MEDSNLTPVLFIDLDGTCFNHVGTLSNILRKEPMQDLLPGVREKFDEWSAKGYYIVITTARPESMRNYTETQLQMRGLFYNQLVMNLPHGARYVINDDKPGGIKTAYGISLERNKGLSQVEI